MNSISTLPNVISAARLIVAPVLLVLLIRGEHRIALIIFLAAAFSDLLDGYLARRYQLATKLGAFLDPVADKLLVVPSVAYFVVLGLAPWWWLGLIVLRDVCLLVGLYTLKTASVQIDVFPTIVGKTATAFNMIALVFLIAYSFKPILSGPFIQPLVILASFFTFASFIQYAIKWYLIYSRKGA